MRFLRSRKRILVVPLLLAFVVAAGTASVALAVCGPFTDVGSLICPFVLSMYYLGVTAGTSSTTYSPSDPVSRGQMAIFMGALYRQVKSTENPTRVGRRAFGSPLRANFFNNFATVNTSDPVSMTTEGDSLNYFVNWANNTIDECYRGYNRSLYASFSGSGLVTGYGIVCDGSDLYNTSGGTSVQKIQLNNGAIISSWAAVPSGSYHMVDSGRYLGVTTSSGLSIVDKLSAVDLHDVALGAATGVIWDGSTFWCVDNFIGVGIIDQVDLAGNLVRNLALDGLPIGDIAFDGQNVWVPTNAGVIDIVATKGAQIDTIVDRIGLQLGGTSWSQGIVFTGQHVVVGEIGDFGCGAGTTVATDAFDAETHALADYTGGFPCGTADAGYGFDGNHVWLLGGGDSTLRIF